MRDGRSSDFDDDAASPAAPAGDDDGGRPDAAGRALRSMVATLPTLRWHDDCRIA